MGAINGLERAFFETVIGIITYYMVTVSMSALNFDPIVSSLVEIALTFSAIFIFSKMRYWSTDYLVGWFVGLVLLSAVGMIQGLDFVLLCFPTALFLVLRLSSRRKR